MIKNNLRDYTNGWIVGNFDPTILKTEHVEVGIKKFRKGDKEDEHKHPIATEISVVILGRVKMKEVMNEGDICVLKNEWCGFEALEDTVMLCIKCPSVLNDKELK